MFVNETLSGRYVPEPDVTLFPNVTNNDSMIVQTNIPVNSMCSHHFQNIEGVCHIGILPAAGKPILGLSKIARIVEYYAKRPNIQEELTVQIADHINRVLEPNGVIVVINATHNCMTIRGVKAKGSTTTTSHIIGDFIRLPIKQEFFGILNAKN
jgi:GTP cyclohydrolase I